MLLIGSHLRRCRWFSMPFAFGILAMFQSLPMYGQTVKANKTPVGTAPKVATAPSPTRKEIPGPTYSPSRPTSNGAPKHSATKAQDNSNPAATSRSYARRPAPKSAPAVAPKPENTYTPRPMPSTTYKPSASSASGSTSNASAVTYTPHIGRSTSAAGTDAEITHANGVTTYTPRTATAAAPISSRDTKGANAASKATPPATIEQMKNAARAGMRGINSKPLPRGVVTQHPNGGLTVKTTNGNEYTVRRNGTIKSFSNRTETITFRSNGRVAGVHRPNLDIRRSVTGTRTIVTPRPGGALLVSTSPRTGYLQRTTILNGRGIVQRTYVSGGRTFTRTYLRYTYAGSTLPYYVPGLYYSPAFYGWAYYPWPAPVPYAWTWTSDPWYGSYGAYFVPYPEYPSGFAWLTDYVLSQALASAYADRVQQMQDSESASYDDSAEAPTDDDTLYAQQDAAITPELKDDISAEIQHDIAYESAVIFGQAQPDIGEFPASLKQGRVFVVSSAIDVSTPDDYACSLTSGDVLRLDSAREGSGTADLFVASSHRQDCPVGIEVTLSLVDLQEMVNTLRAQLDDGLAELHADQGQGGLPTAPMSSMGPAQPSQFAAQSPDAGVGAMIDQQRKEATVIETAAVQSAFAAKQ